MKLYIRTKDHVCSTGLKHAFMCPMKSIAWAAHSSGALIFLFPEDYPNIDVANGSLRKEVCDMKFKIIVFKFVVSRSGFCWACQTFSFCSELATQIWISFVYSEKQVVIQPLCRDALVFLSLHSLHSIL